MSTYGTLREMVLAGAIPASGRVSEASLATALAVSRTPVREALQRLEADGLVFAAGRGVQVRVLSAGELNDVLETRAALEGAAAARLAARVAVGEVAPARLTELDALAAATDTATRLEDLSQAVLQNRHFHEAVVQLAGNPVMLEAVRRLWDQIQVATRAGLDRPARVEEVDADHRRLLDAIRAGDASAAREAAAAHVTATRATLQEGRR